jgi:Tfp pilus assembly protein PilO
MKPQDLLDKHKHTVGNVIIILIAAFIAFNIYKKQAENGQTLKNNIEIERNKNKILSNLVGLEEKVNSYKSLLVRKEARIFMNSMGDLASESGVNIASIKPREEESKKDYIRVPFDLIVTASSYHALGRFINTIENSQDVYMIDSVNIISSDSEKKLTATMTVSSIIFGS